MTFDARVARRKLVARIAKYRTEREQQKLFEKTKGNVCDHEWKMYRESIRIDWNAKAMRDKPREYNGPAAPYFIVQACGKCKTKRYVDMCS